MAPSQILSHQVDILYGNWDPNPICVGTLISSYLVLTVYSCLVGKNRTELDVRAPSGGAWRNQQTRYVDSIHHHPAFKRESFLSQNDIAILVLESAFQFGESLTSINVIEEDSKDKGLLALSPSSCENTRVERIGRSDSDLHPGCSTEQAEPNLICVKTVPQHSCPRPLIGSGLICQVQGLSFLCGALAVDKGNVRVYTDISKYLDWIRLIFKTVKAPKKMVFRFKECPKWKSCEICTDRYCLWTAEDQKCVSSFREVSKHGTAFIPVFPEDCAELKIYPTDEQSMWNQVSSVWDSILNILQL